MTEGAAAGRDRKVTIDAIGDFVERIDVRSPSEYAEDHVPGAESHPVLDDGERAWDDVVSGPSVRRDLGLLEARGRRREELAVGDRGVGGATADAVGRRLARLAETAQVLVVTHSPQVAARGAHHWRVEKSVSDEVTTSTVVDLKPAERVDEIARMLAGDTVTDAARDAARALLAP